MMNLMPFSRMSDFFDAFDDKDYYDNASRKVLACRTDIKQYEGGYIMEAELPGFEKSEISIDINDKTLAIRAEHKPAEEGKVRYIRRERSLCAYQRSFDISGIDADKITAEYKNGLLILTLPIKVEQPVTGRKLEIN